MVTVAIDVGPLHGARTGIGNAVDWTVQALGRPPISNHITLVPYVISMRAKVTAPQRRLPVPAALAHRCWAHSNRPRMDSWLGRPDVVHGTNYVVPPAAAPRLVSVYDCWFLDNPTLAHPDVARAGQILRRSVRNGAHIVTSSATTAERCRAHFGDDLSSERLHVVHLGPPPAVPMPDSTTDPAVASRLDGVPFVLAIGTLERRKNVPLLVRAFAVVAATHPTALLVLAGRDGDDSPAIEAALATLRDDARSRVLRLGPVDETAKSWLLAHARVLAYPSLDEGFGFPVLEAQQAGTPVVASTAGSIPEVAGDAALLVPPGDVDGLATQLLRVLDDDDLATSLTAKGRINLERFSWAATAERLASLYLQLAEGTS